MKLGQLKHDQENCISNHEFLGAERLKNEISEAQIALTNLKEEPLSTSQNVEKRTDILTTKKCLHIAAGILRSPQLTILTDSLESLKEEFIIELLMSANDSIRVKAFRCFALYCIIDKKSASNGIHIFSTPVSISTMIE